MDQHNHRSSKARSEQRGVPTKKVSFIQLMRWEAEFALSGREKLEQYGEAFCKDFEIDDARLMNTSTLIARRIVFSRYLVTDVRHHQHAANFVEDLAELYPVDPAGTRDTLSPTAS